MEKIFNNPGQEEIENGKVLVNEDDNEVIEMGLDEAVNNGIELPKPLLSICVITSTIHKETKLKEFLDNLPKSTDIELCLVETIKSKKYTKELKVNHPLLKMGEMCYKEFSFSDARNYVKSLATGKWILSMDMDEIFPTFLFNSFMETLKELNEGKYKGVRIGITSSATNLETKKFDRIHVEQVKLFRNIKEIKWIGSIHELVEWTIKDEDITDINFSLYHTGYDMLPEEWNEKLIRNIRGLGKEIYSNHDKDQWYRYLQYMKDSIGLFEKNLKSTK